MVLSYSCISPTNRQPFNEKLKGLKEVVEGKIIHNPELAEKGKERRTGELKRKKEQEDDVGFVAGIFRLVYALNVFFRRSTTHSTQPAAMGRKNRTSAYRDMYAFGTRNVMRDRIAVLT
jgi:hypothetical protein